jgi:S-adenosylmethionine/arginine decarboxylase-like enzyme
MTPFMGPFVHNVEDGSSAFMGWMESGTQIHTWHKYKFISIDVYSCKPFEVGDALNTVIKWWRPIVMEVKNV